VDVRLGHVRMHDENGEGVVDVRLGHVRMHDENAEGVPEGSRGLRSTRSVVASARLPAFRVVCVVRGSRPLSRSPLVTRRSLGFRVLSVFRGCPGNAEFQIAFTSLPPHNPVPEIRRRTSADEPSHPPADGSVPPCSVPATSGWPHDPTAM
jgi:hypothetical protein